MANFYILREQGSDNILSFATTPFIAGAGQYQEAQVVIVEDEETPAEAALRARNAFASRFGLTASPVNFESGTALTTITVTTNQAVGSIDISVQGYDPDNPTQAQGSALTYSVPISSGVGTATLSSANPAVIVIAPSDRSAYFGSFLVRAT